MTSTSTSASDAPIEIAAADPSWPAQFGAERDRLQAVLGPWLAGAIEHVGSTAVPGLAAKPVIDIMAPVHTLDGSVAAIDAARSLGYHHHPYLPDVMHWFCKPSPAHRTHHLHLVPLGSPRWVGALAFRDALRRDPGRAAAYEALKRALAQRFPHDREAYTEGKAAFVNEVVADALRDRLDAMAVGMPSR